MALVVLDLTVVGTQFILVAAGLAALVSALLAELDFSLSGQVWGFVLSTLVFVPVMMWVFNKTMRPTSPGPREPGWEKGEQVVVVRRGDSLVAKLHADMYPLELVDGSAPVEGERLIVEKLKGITVVAYRPARTVPPENNQ
ncbi:MAG TPA: hypothetical protein VKA13_02855 [Gammaproteobacteria bacterium]|nr:hypothetical protein [Gammaproteobacteria bacterium]